MIQCEALKALHHHASSLLRGQNGWELRREIVLQRAHGAQKNKRKHDRKPIGNVWILRSNTKQTNQTNSESMQL